MILLGVARKEGLAIEELEYDAGRTPDVHRAVVALGEQHLGRPIPQGDHNRGEFHVPAVGLGQTKIGYLQMALRRDEQILRLQISVNDAMGVQKVHSGQ